MKKVCILYFSGAGSTKKVANLMYKSLYEKCDPQQFAFEEAAEVDLNSFDALIIGTPVYHAAPSRIVSDYFREIRPLRKRTPAFLYNTRALWSCNTNRILAKQVLEKNIVTILYSEYRSPASDGALLVPFIRRFFEFQPDLGDKVSADCGKFLQLLEAGNVSGRMPPFRASSIINAPNKLAGQLSTFPIHLHSNRCIRCGECAKNCPHGAIAMGSEGIPEWNSSKCENCYRCIHHCPGKALSLSKRRAPEKLLNF